jgi:hypothetical protein
MNREERFLLELCARTMTLVLWHLEQERPTAWDELQGSAHAIRAALGELAEADRQEKLLGEAETWQESHEGQAARRAMNR